jgi:hypothetical protein
VSDRSIEKALERTFKQAESLGARKGEVVLDGDLSEWKRDTSLAVHRVSQVLGGEEVWSGPRDASFAVAARLHERALCLAIRVRDDEIIPGADRIYLEIDGADYKLPVNEQGLVAFGPDVSGVFTDKVSFGIGLEFCAGASTWRNRDGVVPFRALYVDNDDEGAETILATAPDLPWLSLAGVKLPGLGSRAEARPW